MFESLWLGDEEGCKPTIVVCENCGKRGLFQLLIGNLNYIRVNLCEECYDEMLKDIKEHYI